MSLPDPIDLTGRFPEIWSTASQRVCILQNAYAVKIAERLNDEESTVTFKLPATDPLRSAIQNECWVKFPALGEACTYRVRNIDDARDEAGLLVATVLGEAAWYELATVKVVYKLELTNVTAYQALSQILSGTGWGLATVETQAINSISLNKANALAGVRQVQQTWGGELHFDVLARQVYLVEEWGSVRPVQIHWQTNLKSMTRHIDTRDVVTTITAYGHDAGAGAGPISVTVSDHSYLQESRIAVIENGDIADVNALRTWAMKELAKRCTPKCSYEAAAADLSILPAHATETFGVGDTVQVIDDELGISVSVRVVEREYDVLEPWRSRYVLGNLVGEFTDSVVKIKEDTTEPVEPPIEPPVTPPDNLQDCIDNSGDVLDSLAALVTQAYELWNTAFYDLGHSMDGFGEPPAMLSLPSEAGPAYAVADPDTFGTVLNAMWECIQSAQGGIADLSALLPPLTDAIDVNDPTAALAALAALTPVSDGYANSVACVTAQVTALKAAADEPLPGVASLEMIFHALQTSIQSADLSASDRAAQLAVVNSALNFLGRYRSDLDAMRALADQMVSQAGTLDACVPSDYLAPIAGSLDPAPCCDVCDYIVDGIGIPGQTWKTLKLALMDVLATKAHGSKVVVCLTEGDHYVDEDIEFYNWEGDLTIKGGVHASASYPPPPPVVPPVVPPTQLCGVTTSLVPAGGGAALVVDNAVLNALHDAVPDDIGLLSLLLCMAISFSDANPDKLYSLEGAAVSFDALAEVVLSSENMTVYIGDGSAHWNFYCGSGGTCQHSGGVDAGDGRCSDYIGLFELNRNGGLGDGFKRSELLPMAANIAKVLPVAEEAWTLGKADTTHPVINDPTIDPILRAQYLVHDTLYLAHLQWEWHDQPKQTSVYTKAIRYGLASLTFPLPVT